MVSPAEAAGEVLARRAARSGLIAFTEYRQPRYRPAPHHHLIARRLEAVERGEIQRLAIFMPPRHGKSELASRSFPAWFLGRNPNKEVISASYNSDLAGDFGRDVREIVRDPAFRNVFPGVKLRQDSQAADRWQTEQGGAYRAAGVGTAMTGRGADLLIIDDPFKDRMEADSELQRQRVWDWYASTAYTRLMPGGRIVLIQTRWHDDDLAGRILSGSDDWEVLALPAIDSNGQALWAEQYDLEVLNRIKSTIGPREWSALYQQQPQAEEGTFFKRDWFKRWTDLPTLRIYGTSDYAVSEGKGDYTVLRIWGVSASGAIYLLAGWRGQATSDVWIERQCELIRKWRPLCWFGEAGVIQKAIEPMLLARMRATATRCRLEWLPSIADKPTRARGIQSRAAMGEVWLPEGAEGDLVLEELTRFPAGKHDDEVDAAALLGRALDMAHPAIGDKGPPPKPNKRDYGLRSARQEDSAWTV